MTWLRADDERWIAAVAVMIGSIVVGLIVRRTVLRGLESRVDGSSRTWGPALVRSLRRPLLLWCLLGGGYVVVKIIGIPPTWTRIADKLAEGILVVSLTVWVADLGARLLAGAAPTDDGRGAPVTSVLRAGVRILVFAIGVLVLLETLGISITPVLTGVGIGGLAVALGLQDTLSNVFAGVHLTLAKNVRVGDFIQLETGQQGYVEDIRWRATRIRTIESNFVLVPNSRLAKDIVINFQLPEKHLAVTIELGVHYSSDLGHVEEVVREVAREVMKSVKGGVPAFEPTVWFHTFGPSSIDLTVMLQAHEFADTFVVKHEFIKAVARRFGEEGIVIPYPISALNLDQERTKPPAAT
ncbi:MAG: mechanosensitive ion channel family protein [Kofleriaceae bacterium]